MAEWKSMSRREKILALCNDSVIRLVISDRKEDEVEDELGASGFRDAVRAGELTIDDMVEAFRAALQEILR